MTSETLAPASVAFLLAEIEKIGLDTIRGGYYRPVYSTAELDLREWFIAHAEQRGLEVEQDHNGAIHAWWHGTQPELPTVYTGSHLDSVPGGGAFDGPLGVASALAAVDILRSRGITPERSLVVSVFPEEEGSRFGLACLGSRLMTGSVTREAALALTDPDGNTFADTLVQRGLDPERIGPDPKRLETMGTFVELHVEQGRALEDIGRAVAVGTSIIGHGRWRLTFTGQGNHAGTTLMADRRDPLVPAALTIAAIQRIGRETDNARATVGRLVPTPGGTNVIASTVDMWIDVRHPDDSITRAIVAAIRAEAEQLAELEGCSVGLREESFSRTVDFDHELATRLSKSLGDAPLLDTGAGHDAGVLSSHVPSAMLFVRNPTGISHSPEEYARDSDAEEGAVALADVLQELVVAHSTTAS